VTAQRLFTLARRRLPARVVTDRRIVDIDSMIATALRAVSL
jgi:hypothetical protein